MTPQQLLRESFFCDVLIAIFSKVLAVMHDSPVEGTVVELLHRTLRTASELSHQGTRGRALVLPVQHRYSVPFFSAMSVGYHISCFTETMLCTTSGMFFGHLFYPVMSVNSRVPVS